MTDATLSALLHENRRFGPPPGLAAAANAQPGIHADAAADPIGFWESQAKRLTWETPWTEALDWSDAPFAKWFVSRTWSNSSSGLSDKCRRRSNPDSMQSSKC
jgi:acetyl-CoA synthetase